ncbi:MAG: UbiX family flavin prenyltransferase [Bacteroidia bacterium]|nr:UbiX family flavin prenyltransferase [Bacteroidia bacterium]
MEHKKIKIIIAITGASGAPYALRLIEKIEYYREQTEDVAIVFSENGKLVWDFEIISHAQYSIPFRIYRNDDFFAPFASGSAGFYTMIICPCTMGSMGKIANGISDDLISRAADVILKERRKLILVTREMPLNLVHIENMKKITMAGGIICPASPSFYSKPESIDQLIDTVVNRVLSLAGFDIESFRWGDHA